MTDSTSSQSSSEDSEEDETIPNGDPQALADYIEQKRGALTGFTANRLSDALKKKIEAADIVQEVSISAISACNEIDFTKTKPFNWLCTLVERRIIDAHRKYFGTQKRAGHKEIGIDAGGVSQKGFAALLVASMTSASAAFSRDQKEFRLQQAMQEIPELTRQVLHLRYVEGLSTRAIAEQLNKTDGTVRVLISRAVSQLQKILGPENSQ